MTEIVHLWFPQIHILLQKKGGCPLQPHTYTFWQKRDWNCALLVPPKYTFFYEKKSCPLQPPDTIYFCKVGDQTGPEIMYIKLAKYKIFLDKQGLYPFATPKIVYI